MTNYRVHIQADFYFYREAKTKKEAIQLARDFYINNDMYEYSEDEGFNQDWDIVDIYPCRLTKWEKKQYGK